jgi:Mg2+-importing ATPase
MVVIVLFVLTVNLLLDRPVIESLLFAVALAVGLSPELLPAIISVTLSAGARAMSRRGVIVRRLDAIENLGSMTVLCTDKTGTHRRTVSQHWPRKRPVRSGVSSHRYSAELTAGK